MTTVRDKLIDFFVSKEDAEIIKTNGESVVVIGASLSIFADPISARTRECKNVKINVSDIKDIIKA